MGGCTAGGYVNDASQDNPTYEFFPSRGPAVVSQILQDTLPANLYPFVFLLPSGLLFVQSNWASALLNYTSNEQTDLPDMIDAVRVYPGSAGVIVLPQTPDNNFTMIILFCGGSNVQPAQY